MQGMGNTASPTATAAGIKTPFATTADTLLVTQVSEDFTVVVQLFERMMVHVSDNERHPTAGADIAIRENGNEAITCSATIGCCSTRCKLEGAMKRNRRFPEPAT